MSISFSLRRASCWVLNNLILLSVRIPTKYIELSTIPGRFEFLFESYTTSSPSSNGIVVRNCIVFVGVSTFKST